MVLLPIEEAAQVAVQNNSDLNIKTGKIAAMKALAIFIEKDVDHLDKPYVPDISETDQRLDAMTLMSYNSIRNAWIAMYQNWNYPDLFVVVECANGSVYTQVNKHVDRASDHTQATLW